MMNMGLFSGITALLFLATAGPQALAGNDSPVPAVSERGCASFEDAKCISCERRDDQIWLISARGVPCLSLDESLDEKNLVKNLKYWRSSTQDSKWNKSTLENLQADDIQHMQSVVWVHGDRMEACEAFDVGRQMYRELVRCTTDKTPIRFIIFSWPSAKTLTRPVADARLKASRTLSAGIHLAGLLKTIPQEDQVSLIGFSFGVRVIATALHLLGGGDVAGATFTDPVIGHQKYRVVFLASAINCDWLEPGHKFGKAIDEMESLLLLNNYCDRILKHYGKLYCHCARRGPEALGYTGLTISVWPEADQDRIRQFNSSGFVGKQHAWRPYIYSPQLMSMIRRETLGETVVSP